MNLIKLCYLNSNFSIKAVVLFKFENKYASDLQIFTSYDGKIIFTLYYPPSEEHFF